MDAESIANMTTAASCQTGTITSSFSFIVQGVLAGIAFASLIVKRLCEPIKERRPWKIWFFDTSKQGFGALLIHVANLLLSSLFKDSCIGYFMNFFVDSTAGVLIIYVEVKIVDRLADRFHWVTLKSGVYGDPPKWCYWFRQCCLYFLLLIIMKALDLLLLQFHFISQFITLVSNQFTSGTAEIVLFVFVFPLIVNAIIFWIIDGVLMQKKSSSESSSYCACLWCCPCCKSSVRYDKLAKECPDNEEHTL